MQVVVNFVSEEFPGNKSLQTQVNIKMNVLLETFSIFHQLYACP